MQQAAQISKQSLLITGAFVLPLVVLGVVFEQWYAFLIPGALLTVWLTLYRLDWAMWFIVFATPVSVTLQDLTGGAGLSIPTEPMLVLVTFLAMIKMVFLGQFNKAFIKHPISIAIYIYVLWMIFTSITSELPLVSFKQVATRVWFIVPYYFVLGHMFLRKQENMSTFLWLFLITLTVAALYTLYVHSGHGFSKKTSTWVMFPLFKEHTSYGAVLAMMFPAALFLTFRKSSWGFNAVAGIILLILTVATILSYTRAAWLSLVGAGAVYMIYALKMSKRTVWSLIVFVLILGAFNFNFIASKFERNTTDSSENLDEHVASVTNVSTDASNLERINRWNSALRMFQDRPVFGHGPGTYMFLYAPYQKPSEKTIISTNAGNRGNAHSEYLGPLAESGVLGLLIYLFLIFQTVLTAIKSYPKLLDSRFKGLLRVAFLGLITYYLHGFLNNFLDMDKASAPFWGFTAVLAVLSIRSTSSDRVSS